MGGERDVLLRALPEEFPGVLWIRLASNHGPAGSGKEALHCLESKATLRSLAFMEREDTGNQSRSQLHSERRRRRVEPARYEDDWRTCADSFRRSAEPERAHAPMGQRK